MKARPDAPRFILRRRHVVPPAWTRGISLIPPLCASGYGFGTQAWPIAGGAALLFLTNLVAIVVVGTVSFVAAGFNRVDVRPLELEALSEDVTDGPVTRGLARWLSRLFESRWGAAMRLLMPFLRQP